MRIGDQQDVADFNDMFLKTVARGFEVAATGPPSDTKAGPALVKQLTSSSRH